MKVLLTGAAGFIGSHAVDHFCAMGDEVVVLDKFTYAGKRANLVPLDRLKRIVQADICDVSSVSSLMQAHNFDVVVNFAAETHVDNSILNPQEFVKTNFEGASNLMDMCRRYNALFVQISTDEVYGDASEDSNLLTFDGFRTYSPLKPRNPYAACKAAADLMLLANNNTHNQPYLIFRPSNNFGPRQNKEKFIPKLLESMITCDSKKQDFPLYGDGKQIREWTYAPDTVRIIRNVIASGERNSIVNISSGFTKNNTEIIDYVDRCYRSLGMIPNANITHVTDRAGHDRRYWIKSDISQDQFTPFEIALKTTVKSYYQELA